MAILTDENYYSAEMDREYMSTSQFKNFYGTWGRRGCEYSAMEKLAGRWEDDETTAMQVGSYVDAYFEGTLDKFRTNNPEIFKKTPNKYEESVLAIAYDMDIITKPEKNRIIKNPEKYKETIERLCKDVKISEAAERMKFLKSDFVKAEEIIARLGRDRKFMKYMSGQKQVIMTGELFGAKWKIKMDSYIPKLGIIDLKIMASITDLKWAKDTGYLDFIRYWNYDFQGAIYQEIVRQNTGKKLPFYIAVATKEREPDIQIVDVSQYYLDEAMNVIEYNLPRILRVKNGEAEPDRCELCDCCRHNRVLTAPISINDLTAGI